ncbi:unnamed protein product [Rhizoctonia solani]|uniref:Transmembrane protein n=1 Tax=Rhizoctonia solani TaxID=456999 RepID=A0A8H3DXZ8_9AGAM|nr:unnamed protein product [Rhizoctonia solani]
MDLAPALQNVNPALVEQIRIALRGLETLFNERAEARDRGDQAQVALIDDRIPPAMRRVGDAYPNEETRLHWYREADKVESAELEEKEHILLPLAKGLGILIAAPLALAFGIVGGAVFTAGSILCGVAFVVRGLGQVLTGATNPIIISRHNAFGMADAPPEYNANPPAEEQIRIELRALEALFEERRAARERNDPAQVAVIEERIAQTMRRVGDAYPNEETRQHWYRQAENLERATPEQREHILMPIAKGLGILIAAPLALAFGIVGGVVFAAGSILYGAGKVVVGLGTLLTGGWFRG